MLISCLLSYFLLQKNTNISEILSSSMFLLSNIPKKINKLEKRNAINIHKRFMHRTGPRVGYYLHSNTFNSTSRAYYSTKTAANLTKQAVQDLANDGSGKHPHVMENFCILKGCENKKCPSLCDQSAKYRILGHNTHKPPIGRFARFIDDYDANGDLKKQYFVSTNEKKEITEQEKQNYGKNLKPNPKQTNYIQNHEDKYDDK